MSHNFERNEFIKAYQFYTGVNKKTANQIYKNQKEKGEDYFIQDLIQGYYEQTHCSFVND